METRRLSEKFWQWVEEIFFFLRATPLTRVHDRFPTVLFLEELISLGLSKSESEFEAEAAMAVFSENLALKFDKKNHELRRWWEKKREQGELK